MLPHLNRAYGLAFWLVKSRQDAEDLVQESYLKAYRKFDTFSGGNAAAWILTIVRNTCVSWLRNPSRVSNVLELDSIRENVEPATMNASSAKSPEE